MKADKSKKFIKRLTHGNCSQCEKLFLKLTISDNEKFLPDLVIEFLDASTHLYKRLCPSVGLSAMMVLFSSKTNKSHTKRLGNFNKLGPVWANLGMFG